MPETIRYVIQSNQATFIPADPAVDITNVGGQTIYYDDAPTVSTSSNDGSIAAGATASFTGGQYLISASPGSRVHIQRPEVAKQDLRVTDDLDVRDDVTVTDDLTVSGQATFGVTDQPASIQSTLPSSATSGTDTAFADGTLFLTSIFVPCNFSATGIGFLVGSVGGTDKVVVRLYNTAGAIVASSTVTASGTTAGTAAQIQKIAFTSVTAVTGPNRYYIGVSANGNTAKLRTVPAYTGAETFSGSVSLTHAATTAITAPTAFAADKAPFAFLY